MAIDWLTVSAQIVNFLILVWLLKRFLYQPVMQAMDRREQRINERLSEAQEREKQAEKKADDFDDKREELEHKSEQILEQAKREAGQEKKRLLEVAREEASEKREQWLQQIEQEKADFLEQLQKQSVKAVHAISRKVLEELAGLELEKRVIDRFLERLEELGKDERRAFADSDDALQITTAFELDNAMRERIGQSLRQQIDADIDINFSRDPGLWCGIELSSGERRLSWCMANYSDELAAHIDEVFDSSGQPSQEG